MSVFSKQNEAAITTLLDQPVNGAVGELIEKLSKRRGVAAILFYGNRFRDKDADGLVDLYILTDSNRTYHGVGLSAFFNKVLPPNVYYEEMITDEGRISAKVAVITLSAFHAKMSPESWDTTLWARFSQPAVLAYCRDDESRERVIAAIMAAYETALWWAFRLAEDTQSSKALWTHLFTRTYGAELRVESGKRAETIVEKAPELYEALYQAYFEKASREDFSKISRHKAERQWERRRTIGKTLNVSRLIKAAFTFRGGIAYALSKVERHSGRPVILKRWEQRWPWLAVPFVFYRLLKERRLR